MSDRQLRSKIGQYSTAEKTSDEKETPEITGQTLAQHSEKELLTPENTAQHEKGFLNPVTTGQMNTAQHEKGFLKPVTTGQMSSLSTGTADTQMTVTAAIALASHEKSEIAIFLKIILQKIITDEHARYLLDMYPCETREDLSLVTAIELRCDPPDGIWRTGHTPGPLTT